MIIISSVYGWGIWYNVKQLIYIEIRALGIYKHKFDPVKIFNSYIITCAVTKF